jgi:large subunit ribosomal protein L7/L12
MADTQKLLEEISKLTIVELSELVKAMEEKFGVSSAPVAAAAGAAAAGAAEKKDEQSTFDVVLVTGGAQKIAVIKVVRELVPTLGLKEAKDLVEAGNKEVLTGVSKAPAEEAKKKLTEAGATVELK